MAPSKAPTKLRTWGRWTPHFSGFELHTKKNCWLKAVKNEENDRQEMVYFFGISSGGRFKPFGGDS